MKKFKLIKKYPGCGIETNNVLEFENTNGHNTICMRIGKYDCTFLLEDCEKYPEFWEEVKEKDYEILSFMDNGDSKTRFWALHTNNEFKHKDATRTFSLEHMLDCLNNLKTIKIHSIKRLPDGEIFTIGDKIKHSFTVKSDKLGIITEFEINNNAQIIVNFKRGYDVYTLSQPLNLTIKLKQPLFTTEDGVDIYDEKQRVFSVSECDFKLQTHQDYGWVSTRHENRKYHHFSTKEKAEEWIIENKPCLSYNDVINTITWLTNSKELLKELVKEKIK